MADMPSKNRWLKLEAAEAPENSPRGRTTHKRDGTLRRASKPKGGKRSKPLDPDLIVTDEALLAALRKNAGLVAQTAEALGRSYQTVWQRVQNHPEWATIIAESRAKITDIAEAHFIRDVQKGEPKARDKWLRYHAKDRGYVTGVEISGPNGSPIPVNMGVDVTIKLVRSAEPKEDK